MKKSQNIMAVGLKQDGRAESDKRNWTRRTAALGRASRKKGVGLDGRSPCVRKEEQKERRGDGREGCYVGNQVKMVEWQKCVGPGCLCKTKGKDAEREGCSCSSRFVPVVLLAPSYPSWVSLRPPNSPLRVPFGDPFPLIFYKKKKND